MSLSNTNNKFAGMTNQSFTKNKISQISICIALTALIFGIYWQTFSHDFTNFDDNLYVTDNGYIQEDLSSDSIAWAFT